ncbi:Kinesin-like protein KIN12B [Acorus calamus]|uniref:Kinesin-like protein KIN12B n=1 Tax=Acorus calamus TaxID=4465 RepID=A0AAV9CND3_ACOCL|nr:Kinesin-like protein KIN12B [Acorus calamus]
MKSLSHQRTGILRGTPPTETTATITSPFHKRRSSPRLLKNGSSENIDPNTNPCLRSPCLHPPSKVARKSRSPLPPRPPPPLSNSNTLKRKLNMETLAGPQTASDSGVKVIVRMRPPDKEEEGGEQIVQKISPNSLLMLEHTFTFDSVTDTGSTQQDIFQLVGVPLVENCLAGFNSSIFAYGQEQVKHADKQIREDVKSGVYVDNLTEECVCSIKDVTQLLLKTELTGAAGERLKEAGSINRSLSQLGNLINILAEVSQSGKQRHIPYRDSRLTFLLQESLGGNAKLIMICAVSPAQSCKNETFSTLRFAQRAKAIKNKAVVNEISQDDVNDLREQIRQLKDELVRMKSNGTTMNINGAYSTGWAARRSLNLLRMSLSRPTALPTINDIDEEMEIDEEEVEKPSVQEVHQPDSCKGINDHMKKYDQLELTQAPEISGNLKAAEPSGCKKEVASEVLLGKNSNMNCSGNEKVDDVNIMGSDLEEIVTSEQCIKHVIGCESEVMPTVNVPCCPHSNVLDAYCHKGDNNETNMILMETKSNAEGYTGTKFLGGECLEELNMEKVSDLLECKSLTECKTMEEKPPEFPDLVSIGGNSVETSVVVLPDHSSITCPNSVIPSSLSLVSCQSSMVPQTLTLSISPRVESYIVKSLRTSLAVISGHQQSSPLRGSLFRLSFKPAEVKPFLSPMKVDVGVQTLNMKSDRPEPETVFICCYCKNRALPLEYKEDSDNAELQLVPIDIPHVADKSKIQAVEKVLAGAIRREMTIQDFCAKQASEIAQLNRLVQQYKHERECNAIIERIREEKISRLEILMDGVLPTEDFMEDEFVALTNEHQLLKEKYENHPEVMCANIELKRVQDELDMYKNFVDMGERDVLLEEIQDLKNQLQYYLDSCPQSSRKQGSLLKLTHSCEPASTPLGIISDSTKGSVEEKFEHERTCWTEIESNWISLSEELKVELEASRSLAEKQKIELDTEKRCTEELKEALQMAMQGHVHILDQYAELQEKHIALLARHRNVTDGIENVKQAAARAGVKGAESKFINSLAAEILALKVEREKERKYWRDENKGLQSQLRDTVEAVQAAGELLVRLKEAEEAAAISQNRAMEAEKEKQKAYEQIDELKRQHEMDITRSQFLGESCLPKETLRPANSASDAVRCVLWKEIG